MLIIVENISYISHALLLILCIWYLFFFYFFWSTTTEVQLCQQAPHFSLSTKDRSLIVDEWWTWQAWSPSGPVWPWNERRCWYFGCLPVSVL